MGRYDAINQKEPKKESFIKKFVNEAILLKKFNPIKSAPKPLQLETPTPQASETPRSEYVGGPVYGYTGVQGYTGSQVPDQGATGVQPQENIQIRVFEDLNVNTLTREAIRQEEEAYLRAVQSRVIQRRPSRESIIQESPEEEPATTGPRSQLLTIMGPFGFRIMIPIRHLNYQIRPTNYTNEMELTIRMSAAESRSLVNDIEAAMRAYGITSVLGGPRQRTVS
jgi:hypothetical protein